jgi:hypothetical protein
MCDLIDPRAVPRESVAAPPHSAARPSTESISQDVYKDMAAKLARAYVKSDSIKDMSVVIGPIHDTNTSRRVVGKIVFGRVRDVVSGASMSMNFMPLDTKIHGLRAFELVSEDMARVIADYKTVFAAMDKVRIILKTPKIQTKRK